MGDFSLLQEIIKEAIGSVAGVVVLIIGAYVTLRINRRKNEQETREKYVNETLVTAYQRIERIMARSPAWVESNVEIRLDFESAISDIQLLADKDNAELAAGYCKESSPEVLNALVVSLRAELRKRLGLKSIKTIPYSSRIFYPDDMNAMPEEMAKQFGEQVYEMWKKQQLASNA